MDRLISEGLTGKVYGLKNGDEYVALKYFKPDVKLETRKREVDVHLTLHNDAIIKILHHDSEHYHWIIAEFFGDHDMFDMLKSHNAPLSEATARYLFK